MVEKKAKSKNLSSQKKDLPEKNGTKKQKTIEPAVKKKAQLRRKKDALSLENPAVETKKKAKNRNHIANGSASPVSEQVESGAANSYYEEMLDFALDEIAKCDNIVILLYGNNFIAIAKTITLSVKQIINKDGFQPYQPCDDKKYTVVNVIKWGDISIYGVELLKELDDKGCKAVDVYTKNDLVKVLDAN